LAAIVHTFQMRKNGISRASEEGATNDVPEQMIAGCATTPSAAHAQSARLRLTCLTFNRR
jgi:hypothetical protein